MIGSFFNQRAATPGAADAVGRIVGQCGIQFFSAAPNGLFIQARNLGQQTVAAMPDALGFQRYEPAALILVQAAEQHEHLVVQITFRVISALLTQRALTNGDVY